MTHDGYTLTLPKVGKLSRFRGTKLEGKRISSLPQPRRKEK
jgi:hypothetical protein